MHTLLYLSLVLSRLWESDTQKSLPSYLILQPYTGNRERLFLEFPADWKLANISPTGNKDGRADPGNYKLVSLTSVAAKITENILLGATEM